MASEPRADVRAYLEMVRANPGPSPIDLDPAVARQMGRQAAPLVELPARDMARHDIAIPGRGGHTIPARVYRPHDDAAPAPAILFFHGGGWVLGDLDGYDPLCAEVAHALGMTLVSVDYRLAPEHRFPAAVDDALDAAGWVANGAATIGHSVSGLVLAGDSAGGALAAVVARELASAPPVPLLAQWLIYPVTDLSVDYPSDAEHSALFGLTDASKRAFYAHYLGDDPTATRHPHVSPLLGERWAGLPPAVVFACALDPLRDQGRAYAARLAQHGVPVFFHETEQVHGSFTMRRLLPSAQDDLHASIAALKALLDAVHSRRGVETR